MCSAEPPYPPKWMNLIRESMQWSLVPGIFLWSIASIVPRIQKHLTFHIILLALAEPQVFVLGCYMLYHDVPDPYLDEATSNKIEDVTWCNKLGISISEESHEVPRDLRWPHQAQAGSRCGSPPERCGQGGLGGWRGARKKRHGRNLGMKHVETSRPLASLGPLGMALFLWMLHTLQHIATHCNLARAWILRLL